MLASGNFYGTTTPLIDNTWHHVTLVKNGNTVTIYADGQAENTHTINVVTQDNTLPLLIGFNPGEGVQGFWKGLLDELKIFDRALTPAEIAALAVLPGVLDGDFNDDGTVDAADYVIWRKNGGNQQDFNLWRANFARSASPPSQTGDFNNDGLLDAADYVLWRKNPTANLTPAHYNLWGANFGEPASAGGASSNQVPEPASTVLLAVALLQTLASSRQHATYRLRFRAQLAD
jgi:hypothetical protein